MSILTGNGLCGYCYDRTLEEKPHRIHRCVRCCVKAGLDDYGLCTKCKEGKKHPCKDCGKWTTSSRGTCTACREAAKRKKEVAPKRCLGAKKKTKKPKNCKHCNRVAVLYVGGFCCICKKLPACQVARSHHQMNQGENREPPLPPKPTGILPGPQKEAVFAWRLENGYQLFHPDDAKYKDE